MTTDEPTFLIDLHDLPKNWPDFLVENKIAASKREARQLIEQNGISIQRAGAREFVPITALDKLKFSDLAVMVVTVTDDDGTPKTRHVRLTHGLP